MTAGGIIVGGEASGQRFLPVPAPAGHPPPCGTLTDSVTRGTLDVMKNKVIAKRFESIAGMLEIKGESPFRVDACHNAARTLAELATDARATGHARDDALRGRGRPAGVGRTVTRYQHLDP